jgi:hypothetical protein
MVGCWDRIEVYDYMEEFIFRRLFLNKLHIKNNEK